MISGENKQMKEKCKVDGCNLDVRSKGLCNRHYKQMLRHGKILNRTTYDPNVFIFENDICKIQIFDKQGRLKAEAIIDIDDYNKVKDFKWHISSGTPKTDSNRRKLPIANLLMNIKSDTTIMVDHINLNKLDNRKSNLRICSHKQNDRNEGIRSNNTSGFKGVVWEKGCSKWRARIKVDGKRIHLGVFNEIEQAVIAYNEAAKKYFGEFAYLNNIGDGGVSSLIK